MEMLELETIVHKNLLQINSTATSKAEILEELGERLQKEGFITNKKMFLDDVYLRETEGETGIGEGIAIPHGKSKAVKETTVAIATLQHEIEWETLDGDGVEVVILFAVRDTDANTTHILLLQKIAILLADETFIASIKQVQTIDDLYTLITKS
ncbi:PTS sugar transporter subunit IIA [Listeria riparia]|uniref:PTS system cellobiose-specific transporter subunit IIA n=1 Tax=Listeria riparia FSL S10-1204 TaxID=1265816 RepID=W7DDW1_9LIST|nr:fructose PTS transporter subunit IIA [Listeria riparia]EUJ45711.1 PTS system cellobiose-specific transporter subunit IIA [Listeria riparia FSL S10-1204]